MLFFEREYKVPQLRRELLTTETIINVDFRDGINITLVRKKVFLKLLYLINEFILVFLQAKICVHLFLDGLQLCNFQQPKILLIYAKNKY